MAFFKIEDLQHRCCMLYLIFLWCWSTFVACHINEKYTSTLSINNPTIYIDWNNSYFVWQGNAHVVANGQGSFQVAYFLKDSNDRCLTNLDVNFICIGSNCLLQPEHVVSDANGAVFTTLRSLSAGHKNLKIQVGNTQNLMPNDKALLLTFYAGAAHHLNFDSNFSDVLTNVVAGQSIKPAVAVGVYDLYNNLVVDNNHYLIRLGLLSRSGVALQGCVEVDSQQGLAMFNDLIIQSVGSYLHFQAYSPGLLFAIGPIFEVSSSISNLQTYLTVNANNSSLIGSKNVVIANGNDAMMIQVTLQNSSARGLPEKIIEFFSDTTSTFSVSTVLSDNHGQANTFFTTTQVGTHIIRAHVDNVDLLFSLVARAPEKHLSFIVQPQTVDANGANILAGYPFSVMPKIAIEDDANQIVLYGADSQAQVSLSVFSGEGLLHGITTKSSSLGVVDFSDSNLFFNISGTKVLQANAVIGTQEISVLSAPLTIAPSASANFTWPFNGNSRSLYGYDSNKILVTSKNFQLRNAWQQTDRFFGDFNQGAFVGTSWSDALQAVVLGNSTACNGEANRCLALGQSTAPFNGSFTSRVLSANGLSPLWQGISWNTSLPSGKPLPENSVSESSEDYENITPNLANALVGLWHFEESTLGGCHPQGDLCDTSGHANHAFISGNITLQQNGVFSRAIDFNGSGLLLTSNTYDNPSNFTISTWIKLSNTTNGVLLNFVNLDGTMQDSTLSVSSNGQLIFTVWGGDTQQQDAIVSNQNYLDGLWHHVALSLSSENGVALYVDGSRALLKNSVLQLLQKVSQSFAGKWQFAYGQNSNRLYSNGFIGSVDELALWHRILNDTEILQLYLRGVNRLNIQVRFCQASDCSDNPNFLGPDGTVNSFFSELSASTLQANHLILASAPTVAFSGPLLQNANYLQYRAYFESADTSLRCVLQGNSAPCSTALQQVAIQPGSYPLSARIVSLNTVNFVNFQSFVDTEGIGGCPLGRSYLFSLDGNDWYYLLQGNWMLSDESALQTTPGYLLSPNSLMDLIAKADAGDFYYQVFLTSDGNQPCNVSTVSVSLQQKSPFFINFPLSTSMNANNYNSLHMSKNSYELSLSVLNALEDNTSSLFAKSSAMQGIVYDKYYNFLRLVSSSDPCAIQVSGIDPSWTPFYDNIQYYWSMDGSGDIADGLIIPAVIGNNLIASNADGMGMQYVSSGLVGQAVLLDGIDDYLTILNNTNTLLDSNEITLSLWLKWNALGQTVLSASGKSGIFSFAYSSTHNYFNLTTRLFDRGVLTLINGNASRSILLSAALQTNHWMHLALIGSGQLIILYYNGDLVFSSSLPSLWATYLGPQSSFGKGTTDALVSGTYSGLMDEIVLWDVALSQNDILQIYGQQSSGTIGTLTSRVYDTGNVNNSLTTLQWGTSLPFYKELPDNSLSESSVAYPWINSNMLMQNVVLLWHLNDAASGQAPLQSDILDTSGLERHGYASTSGVGYGQFGILGGAIYLDGLAGSLSSRRALSFSTAFSYQLWFSTISQQGGILMAYEKYPSSYAYSFNEADLKLQMLDSGVLQLTVGGQNQVTTPDYYNDGLWHHVVATCDTVQGSIVIYVDGVQKSYGSLSGNTVLNNYRNQWGFITLSNPAARQFYGDNMTSNYFYGFLDEVAVWNRSLSTSEVVQLYRRGANRISLQLRRCQQANCADVPNWLPHAGWSTGRGISEVSLASFRGNVSVYQPEIANLQNFLLKQDSNALIASGRYLQYRLWMEKEPLEGNDCFYNQTASQCSPELSKIFLGYFPVFSTSNPSASSVQGLAYQGLYSFSETWGHSGCDGGGTSYILSPDGMHWYYYDGFIWRLSNTTAGQSTLGSLLTPDVLSMYNIQVGAGILYFRVFLHSDGSHSCSLMNVSFSGSQ